MIRVSLVHMPPVWANVSKGLSNAPKHQSLADGHLSPKDLREYTGLYA
jgi:hypothetical protein